MDMDGHDVIGEGVEEDGGWREEAADRMLTRELTE